MNKIISCFILSCSLLLSGSVFAQKCNFDKDETDQFTKERLRSSGLIRLSGTPRWWAQLDQKGTKYSLAITIYMLKEVRTSVSKDTKIQIKLEDGTLLELLVADEVIPSFNVEQRQFIVSQWVVHNDITKDLLRQLSKSPIELIRTKIGNDDCNMPDSYSKGTKKLMEMASCMLSNN